MKDPHQPLPSRSLGRTGLDIPVWGVGCAPLGGLFEPVDDHTATATLQSAWDLGARVFDTSPWYGLGLSERRVGDFARSVGSATISTKVGRVLSRPTPDHPPDDFWQGGLAFAHRFDYSASGVARSYEDSLQRLGVPAVDLLVIHDLDHGHHGDGVDGHFADLASGGWDALASLRSGGEIAGIGAGFNDLTLFDRFLDEFDLDFVLIATSYNLLDHEALHHALPRCRRQGVGVILGGVLASGILASGARPGATYRYSEAPGSVAERVKEMERVCAAHDVALPAVATHFALGHADVSSLVLGARSPEEVASARQWMDTEIPGELWEEMRRAGLIDPEAPV